MEKFEEVVSFIRSIYNKPEGFIALHEPVFIGNEKKYIEECINTTFVSSVGRFVERFEEEMAIYTGAKRAVVCVNGTSGLHIALMLSGVKRDDEVITQPLTFVATCNAISYSGAHPVFLDVDKDTLGLSPLAVKEWIKQNTEIRDHQCYNRKTGRRVKACVPMHTFGHPCKIDELVTICSEFHIELIEDAAESVGSFFKGIHTGTFGKIGVLSFNGNKTITTGGGGMLLFQDDELGKLAKHLTTQAKVQHSWKFEHDAIGYNYRMPNINAALGVAQLEQIDLFLKSKRDLAQKYKDFFEQQGITFFVEPKYAKSNYWLNVVLLNSRNERDEFLEYTNGKGIMTRPAWELMNRLPMFRYAECADLSNAEWIADRLVNITSSVII